MKKIKKIVFIETESPNFHVFSRTSLPRLGTILLSTILKDKGYDAHCYVETIEEIDMEDLMSADLVGLSTITSTSMRAYEIAKLLKKVNIPVFLGGPHVTYMPEEGLEHADFVLRGEADDTIVDFIKAFEAGEGFDKITGLSYRKDGEIFHNKTTPFCKDLDTLPYPDFTLVKGLEGNSYKKMPIIPIMTSRGCPYDCHFCSVTSMFGQKYRFRSQEKVLHELQLLKDAGSNWVFFYDDNFIANKTRTKELLQSMIDQELTPKWTAQVRVEVAKDPELIDLMKRSGCHTVYIGLESVNPATLEAYNKSQSLEDIEHCIKILHASGIRIHGMFVFGSDEDTVETIHDTVTFARKNDLQSVQFLMLTPLPGTKLYYDFERDDRIVTKDWSLYDGHHVVYEPTKMTFYQFQTETMKAMRQFYNMWQVVRGVVRCDLFNLIVKAYGFHVTRKWFKTHRQFVEYTKMLSTAGKHFEHTAKKTAEDLKEKFRQFELAGNSQIHKKNQAH